MSREKLTASSTNSKTHATYLLKDSLFGVKGVCIQQLPGCYDRSPGAERCHDGAAELVSEIPVVGKAWDQRLMMF